MTQADMTVDKKQIQKEALEENKVQRSVSRDDPRRLVDEVDDPGEHTPSTQTTTNVTTLRNARYKRS